MVREVRHKSENFLLFKKKKKGKRISHKITQEAEAR